MAVNTQGGRRPSALAEMVKGRLREFLREPSAFFFVLFMPILWMLILGHAFDGKSEEHYGVGWPQAAPASAVAAQVHAALLASPRLHVVDGTPAELNAALSRGEVMLVVEPATETRPVWHYAFDSANREAKRARSVVDQVIQEALGRRDVATSADVPVTVPGTRYIDFLVPGLVALSIMTSSLFGTGAVIVVSRRENLFKRFLVTPMRPSTYFASHVIGRLLTLVVEVAAILVAARWLFDFHLVGSLLNFFLLAMLGAAVFTALAILCGARTSNMAVMNGCTNLISLPMMIVAGVWFARSNFPAWMGEAARWLPLTALVDGLRRIALEGAPLTALGPELAVLGAAFAVCTLAALRLFKWY